MSSPFQRTGETNHPKDGCAENSQTDHRQGVGGLCTDLTSRIGDGGEPEDQRVPLGETLKVKIPISGKGPFTFKIKKNDEPLADSDHVRVQEFDDYIVVTIPGLYYIFMVFIIY